MKPIPVLLLLLAACNNGQTTDTTVTTTLSDTVTTTSPTPTQEPDLSLIAAYRSYVSGLKNDMKTTLAAAQKFRDMFTTANTATADSAFFIFSGHYDEVLKNEDEKHLKDTTDYYPLMEWEGKPAGPVSPKLQAKADTLKKYGFQLGFTEGMSFIKQDRRFIAQNFYDKVSPLLKQYLEQQHKENEEGFASDAAIVLTPEQFTDRILWNEKFIAENPAFPRINSLKENYKFLLSLYMTGMDNTPAFDYGTGKITEEFDKAYTYLNRQYPASETNKLIKPYAELVRAGKKNEAEKLRKGYVAKSIVLDIY